MVECMYVCEHTSVQKETEKIWEHNLYTHKYVNEYIHQQGVVSCFSKFVPFC